MTYDLYVTAGCPHGVRCEACGSEHAPLDPGSTTRFGTLQPWGVRVAAGVLCLTLCPSCAGRITRQGIAPPISDSTAGRLVVQHCGHLRISRAEMAETLTEIDRLARERLAAAVVAGTLAPDPDFLPDGVHVNGGHGVRPPFHEHVECVVCGSTMVHVDERADGRRVYAAHPSIPGEPDSANCSNTDHRIGTHRGRRPSDVRPR